MWGLQKDSHVYIAIGAVVVVLALIFSIFVPLDNEPPIDIPENEAITENSGSVGNETTEKVSDTPTPVSVTAESCGGSFADAFLCLVNSHRETHGRSLLSYDPTLNVVAFRHSEWMAANNHASHIGENGSEFFERCQAARSDCFAENVAYGFRTPRELFSFWSTSAVHNENLLGPYTHMGLGVSGSDTYATAIFR